MAAELITPVDELTGIPLPIVPQDHLDKNDPNVNWHHAWHANAEPELQGLAGRALRHSRVQLVHAFDHNFKDDTGRPNYHSFFKGPELPTTDEEKFTLCLISSAGFIPQKGIDVSTGEPLVVTMTKEQLALLKSPASPRPIRYDEINRVKRSAVRNFHAARQPVSRRKHVKDAVRVFREKREAQADFAYHHVICQYEPVRYFFQQHVGLHQLEDVKEWVLDEFLFTGDAERRQHAARKLLKLAINEISDPIEDVYQTLRKSGQIHHRMPPKARSLVYYKLGSAAEVADLAVTYAQSLGERVGVAA